MNGHDQWIIVNYLNFLGIIFRIFIYLFKQINQVKRNFADLKEMIQN